MNLAHWRHDVLDLASDSASIKNPEMSVLANSVESLNARLLEQLPASANLLEIGCGTHSLLKDGMRDSQVWEGIDVVSADRKGNPTIATRTASVQSIPWAAGSFDYVVSNQSIEHWHEYGVAISEGLSEIHRVLRPNGIAVLNFPIHLHGHRMFVQGEFETIDRLVEDSGFLIARRIAVIDSALDAYPGWRLCGFPDFLVKKRPTHESTSYVVEYHLRKGERGASGFAVPSARRSKRVSVVARHLHYGLSYAAWKVVNRLLSRDRVQ